MEKCYFIINGIKFIIIYDNGNRQILKEVDNQLVKLNDEDKMIIEYLFKYDNEHIHRSEKLTTILNENTTIKKKESLYELFSLIENKIPERCRENFYTNLKTLQINYNLDAITDSSLDREDTSSYESADYNPITNTITINKEYVRNLWRIAQKQNDPQSFFNNYYMQTLEHEITHVASTSYDKETGVIKSGFDIVDGKSKRNRGLTEGMTEVISMSIITGTQEIGSGYYLEACILNQLIQIIGTDTILDSYFLAKGIEPLKHELQKYGLNEIEAKTLFDQIEINYLLHAKYNDVQNNILSSIQSKLLDCFQIKCREVINDPNFNKEQLEYMFNVYGYMLVTPYVIEQTGKNPNNYGGLTENLERFRSLKEQFMNELNQLPTSDINEYRESLKNIYLEEKDNDTVIHSNFNITHGENPQCEHTVERISKDERKIVCQRTFDYNDEFRKQILAPSVIDYADCSPIMSSEIKGYVNQTKEEKDTSNYQAISENNNILSVNNIETIYANEIYIAVEQIEPSSYQQQSQQNSIQQEKEGHQLGIGSYPRINGFTSTILLIIVVGIICLLIIFLGVWILS